MGGNISGRLFRVTTWGESHGPATGCVIDGCPPDLDLSESDIQQALDRRRPSSGPASTARRESDRVEILSGVFEGKTTGTPISLCIPNQDARSSSYADLKDVFRPGHGDYSYFMKYGRRDWRGGGRASGRETAARVAAGAVAQKVLDVCGMDVFAFTRAIGGIEIDEACLHSLSDLAARARADALCCPDPRASEAMRSRLDAVRSEGDTLGGVVEVVVRNCPAGLGEPVFDKLDAALASALMSIGTVKAVAIGDGEAAAAKKGSEMNDPMNEAGFIKNSAGGVLAGISTGQDLTARVYCKPIPSVSLPQQTVDQHGHARTLAIEGRHDICVIPRIIPVCEAMVCLVLADFLLISKAVRP
ncbi:MAG TPA: chorismate synthase [Smithellaceae bacterium]|nr:chorismate synthase [Smithellaceae bacterium]